MSNEQKIWDTLLDAIGNEYGVAGLMGNMKAESGCIPTNLQDTFNKSLGLTDEQYTNSVNSGNYPKELFIHDSAGYGLVQWTFWTLKRDMYEYIREKKKVSIGDLDAQLEFLIFEFQRDFKGVWEILKNATSVRQASDVVLLEFERPSNKGEAVQKRRAEYGQEYYNKFAKGTPVKADSKLVDCIIISPNRTSPRQNTIKKITIHHMAGNLTAEECGRLFSNPDRQGSSNYGIGTDGRVGLYVEEKDRAWTSGNPNNDHQAVNIEVANNSGAPNWTVSDKAYNKLIDLCVDICKRNKIKKLEWTGDATGNLTCHYMFQATACPGPYLKERMPAIAKAVNDKLGVKDDTPTTKLEDAKYKDLKYRKAYVTTAELNLRWGAGIENPIMATMPQGTKVNCYGYYNKDNQGRIWLLVVAKVKYTTYTGYCCMDYLKEA